MNRLLSTRRLFFLFILSLCITLQSCSTTEKIKNGEKVGMHIDTVMDFVVEYPLSWHKERRLTYGSKEGEVLWTQADQPGAVVLIGSYTSGDLLIDTKHRIDQALKRYVGLEVTTEEKVTIPAGEAWHIIGQTARDNVDIYLLFHRERNYLIALTTPLDDIDDYSEIMDEMLSSFQIMLE